MKREPDKEDTVISSLYFDEDAPENMEDGIGVVKKAEEIWTGEGEFILPDFKNFVLFLKSMMNKL